MSPDPTQPKSTEFLPSTVVGWIAVGLIVALLVVFLAQWRPFQRPDVRPIQELAQLRMIGHAVSTYAADHDGLLPDRVSTLQDPEHGYIPTETGMDWFQSPFLENAEMAFESANGVVYVRSLPLLPDFGS